MAIATKCMCPCDTWHMTNGSYEGHMSSERNRKVRGSFHYLDQTKENKFGGGENEKREERKKNK